MEQVLDQIEAIHSLRLGHFLEDKVWDHSIWVDTDHLCHLDSSVVFIRDHLSHGDYMAGHLIFAQLVLVLFIIVVIAVRRLNRDHAPIFWVLMISAGEHDSVADEHWHERAHHHNIPITIFGLQLPALHALRHLLLVFETFGAHILKFLKYRRVVDFVLRARNVTDVVFDVG